MPEVSIIVAAYNGETFIRETLESLLSQTFTDIEIIVVDDGSTDATAEIVREFMDSRLRSSSLSDEAQASESNDGNDKRDERIKYFHKENSGNQAIPRNYGIKKSQGTYVAFCDQDDLWYPEKLEKQFGTIEGERDSSARRTTKSVGMTEDIGILVTSADIVNENGTKVGIRYVPEGYMDAGESFDTLLDEDFITACSALIPRKVLDEVGLLNEDLGGNDDYDLWLRITRKYGVYGISESLCAWRRTEKSYSKDMSRIFLENEKIFAALKSSDRAEKGMIEKGANKNLVRLFIAYVKEKKYDEAKEVLTQIMPFEGLNKAKIVIKIFKVSPSLARTCLLIIGAIKKKV